MGNNQSTDPLKCTREQLQQIINSAIAHSPWINDDSGKKNQSEAEQRKILNNAVELMRVKGFRPITPEEYVAELKRRREECPDGVNSIKIWVPLQQLQMEIYALDSISSDKRSSVSSSASSSSSSPIGRQYDSSSLLDTPTSSTTSSLLSATTLTMEACCITEDDIQYSFTKQSEAVRKHDESSYSTAAAAAVAQSSYNEDESKHQQLESHHHNNKLSTFPVCSINNDHDDNHSNKQLFPSPKSVIHGINNERYYCDAKDNSSSNSAMLHNYHHHHQSAEISLLTTITEVTESSTVSTVEWPIYPKILRKQQQLEHADYKGDDCKADYKYQDSVDYK